MKVLVLLEMGADVRIPPELDPRSGRVREEWLVRETDPSCSRALDLALGLKAVRPVADVTLVHFGPAGNEPWLRQALARGCDRAIRIWDEQVTEVRTAGKAVILAEAARAAGFALVLAGAEGVIGCGGYLGVFVAAHLGTTCATRVVEIGAGEGEESIELVRDLDRGFRERIEVRLPAVVTVAAGGPNLEAATPREIPVAALLAAQKQDVRVWDLADLGVPIERVRSADRLLRHSRARPRRPRLRPLVPPDPALPAFERIRELVRGTVQLREGRVVRRSAEEVGEEIFGTLRDEGWLDHLRPGNGSDGGAPDDRSDVDGCGGAGPEIGDATLKDGDRS